MELLNIEAIGLIAGCMTTSAFVPQVVKTYGTRSVKDISLRMYIFLCSGISLWIIYGIITETIAVIVANIASLMLTTAILVMKMVYKQSNSEKNM